MIFPENALLAMYWITRGCDALTELDPNVLRSSVFTMHETANVALPLNVNVQAYRMWRPED